MDHVDGGEPSGVTMNLQPRPEDEISPARTVAFLGPVTSYTHQAAKTVFSGSSWDLAPAVTIKDVFDAVQARQATFGVVPFENSTHGSVTFTLDCLADREGLYGDLSVCAEIYMEVHHFLLGRRSRSLDDPQGSGTCTPTVAQPNPLRPRARPLTSLKHVQRIYSHPQGFGQTAGFLSTYLKGVETVDVSSTSRAAELAAADASGTSAAIASELAAEQHSLDILARCIEDKEDNTTRFFILRRGLDSPLPDLGPAHGEAKSLVSFTVPHSSPGALADVLDCFRTLQLNLSSINSIPSLARPFQYMFFVEFQGSKLCDPEQRVKRALEKVDKVAQAWRWLGSWENQRRT